jgi:Predicted ATPase
MTKAVLESEGEGEAQRTDGAVPPPVPAVPASLQASLMARLDRLGPAKEVAQIGAAIGRQFSHALLASVVRQPEAELESALDRLIAAGLLFRQGAPPMRPTCSSTPWCRTRHMALFSAINARSCMRVSPRCSNKNSRA